MCAFGALTEHESFRQGSSSILAERTKHFDVGGRRTPPLSSSPVPPTTRRPSAWHHTQRHLPTGRTHALVDNVAPRKSLFEEISSWKRHPDAITRSEVAVDDGPPT